MTESFKHVNAQYQLNHHMKVKRIWTYNQSPLIYQQNNNNCVQEHAKALTQVQNKKIMKKTHFISSLISKIKNVERPTEKSPSRDYIQKKLDYKTNKEERAYKGIEQQIVNTNQNKLHRKKLTKNQCEVVQLCQIMESKKIEIQELKQENLILKEKMSELIIQNERLKIRFKKYSEQLQERFQQVHRKEQQLKKKQESLNYTQENAYQSMKILQKQELLAKFNISLQFEQVIFPTQNVELTKAYQQIKQSKLDKLELQKKYEHTMNQYRKNKQKDFQKLKKGFANNLKYYKDLLLKVSIKSIPESRKYQEDTFQTAILQISSADQS